MAPTPVPVPEEVPQSCQPCHPASGGRQQGEDWSWLYTKLQAGGESVREVEAFLAAGGRADMMVCATLGNREMKVAPCLKTLRVLLQGRANPNLVDGRIGSPLLHVAAWSSPPEVAALLLDFGAKIELGEEGVDTPALNTALAAGNAPVALMLLERRASVLWKHKDGATALHVATAWVSDDKDRSKRRKPPLGDQPIQIVRRLLENGVDPTQREGHCGLTPLDAFRSGMKTSVWLEDPETCDEFKRTSDTVYGLLTAADEAMKLKAKGNKDFSDGRLEAALAAWTDGRQHLEKKGISGHHVAVLWSNEANCSRKVGDNERCRRACEAGMQHYCASSSVKAKLQHHLAECQKPPEDPDALAQAVEAKKEAVEKRRLEAEKSKTKLKSGTLDGMEKPMYGPEGSVQGKNHSDLVKAPVQGQMVDVPFGKIVPVTVPNPYLEQEDSD